MSVRICAIRALVSMIPRLEGNYDMVRPILFDADGDADMDVRYYAGEALKLLG